MYVLFLCTKDCTQRYTLIMYYLLKKMEPEFEEEFSGFVWELAFFICNHAIVLPLRSFHFLGHQFDKMYMDIEAEDVDKNPGSRENQGEEEETVGTSD